MHGEFGHRMRARRFWVTLMVLTASPGAGWGQALLSPANPLGDNKRQGFHLYSASAYVGYTSLAAPQRGFDFLSTPSGLGPDYKAGGAVSLGWNRQRDQSEFSLLYGGSYDALVQHPEWNSASHYLSFSARTKPRNRWTMDFSAAGEVSNFAGFLFTPGVFHLLTAIPSDVDDLAGAVLARRISNNQLASILTGAPVISYSPSRTLLYGDRTLGASVHSKLSYSHSPRLLVYAGVQAARFQHLTSERKDDERGYTYFIPQTTSVQADAGLSYSLTPRTQVGFNAASQRSLSVYQDGYATTGTASLGRNMGKYWFLQARGGVGVISTVRQSLRLPEGPQYLAGGSLGLKLVGHTFLASHDRTIGNWYGFGAQPGYTTTAAWNWWRPGRGLALFSNVSHQRQQGREALFLEGWTVRAGFAQTLSRHTSVRTEYVYLNNAGRFAGILRDLSAHAVRLSIVWTPGPEGFR